MMLNLLWKAYLILKIKVDSLAISYTLTVIPFCLEICRNSS